jgi:dipeptidyl aminopeptidase/acylaminoacyl peptidase
MTTEIPVIDYSHIDAHIVVQHDFQFHAHAPSLDIDVFPPEIETLLGNEQNFIFQSSHINDDNYLVVKYQQANSPYELYLYFDEHFED